VIGKLRAAWWTARCVRAAEPERFPPVPAVSAGDRRAVSLALRAARANCLVRARVMQAWYLAHGEERDLVIGVTAPSKGFRAHAWLDGDPPCHSEGFAELSRQPARR
jgi:hypothetical protein